MYKTLRNIILMLKMEFFVYKNKSAQYFLING